MRARECDRARYLAYRTGIESARAVQSGSTSGFSRTGGAAGAAEAAAEVLLDPGVVAGEAEGGDARRGPPRRRYRKALLRSHGSRRTGRAPGQRAPFEQAPRTSTVIGWSRAQPNLPGPVPPKWAWTLRARANMHARYRAHEVSRAFLEDRVCWAIMPSSLDSFREKFQTALADHERRVLLDMLIAGLSTMTLGELGEVLTSELGVHLKSVAAAELFNAAPERAAAVSKQVPAEVASERATRSGEPRKPRDPRTAAVASAKTITDDVRRALEASVKPMSPRELRAVTGHPETKVRLAVRFFLQQGVVRRSGVGRGTCYVLTSRASSGASASASAVPTNSAAPSAPRSSGVVRRRPSQAAKP